MRILIVEDSAPLADTLKDALEAEHYSVDLAADGQAGLDYADTDLYDLLILDLMLPKMNGYEVLSALRKSGHTMPVLILTAKTELDDKLLGFELGADDYVTKPFEIRELLMRVRAILRRQLPVNSSVLTLGDLCFDLDTCELSNQNTHRSMCISGKELQLLELFLYNPNQVLEKDLIATKIWGYDSNAEYNNVEVYVTFLRRKFRHLQLHVNIRAVRGVGYIMEASDD